MQTKEIIWKRKTFPLVQWNKMETALEGKSQNQPSLPVTGSKTTWGLLRFPNQYSSGNNERCDLNIPKRVLGKTREGWTERIEGKKGR